MAEYSNFCKVQITPKRPNFLRRTKATSPPDVTETDTIDTVETTTSRFTRRGGSKFKSRKETESAKNAGNEIEKRRPSLNGGAARSERPVRNFVRRRLGGANGTTTTSSPPSPSSTTSPLPSRRPFRVASRRRLITSSTTTTTTTTTAEPTTAALSDESLQDIGDTDAIEEPSLQPRTANKSTKVQRRPLLLKDETVDQNPSATNEEERKRQSKKYSSSFKQNQLDEVLKKSKSQEEVDVTTEGLKTTVDDFSPDTALAIAAHQLLSAPIPIIPNYDEKPTKKSTTTNEYKYTSQYTEDEKYEEYTTPIYKTTSDFTTGSVYTGPTYIPRTSTIDSKSSLYSTSPVTKVSRPTVDSSDLLPPLLPQGPTTIVSGYTGVSSPSTITLGYSGAPSIGPSTARYVGSSEKLIPVPVEDYSLSPGLSSREPSYFTREYLLESPVTKTYDDEYQYLSPVTTQLTTTRKIPKKTVIKKISTTMTPTEAYVTTPRPRQVSRRPVQRVPFEKVRKPAPNRTFRPIENYDYYDEGDEKLADNYADTKVIVHGKGTIECLDIGNFPHPTSCKKFISCARLENGSLLGWAYVCPKGLSFDPVGGICNWSAGLGCDEKDL